jgi:D-3-phosphoglycerate dehydrogenase
MRIAISTSSFAVYGSEPLDLLDEAGVEYRLNPHGRKLAPDELVELCSGCAGLVAGTEHLGRDVLERLPQLKALSRCGVGMDNVDLKAARELGIELRNTPYGPTLAVAEMTLGLVLDLLRDISRMDRELRRGVWKKRMGRQLKGKRLGIVGMGRIGMAVAECFAPLGVEIAFADPWSACSEYDCMELDELLRWADVVSLHCSKTEACPLIGAREMDLMREGAYLVNAARGGLVDEAALAERLADGRIAGAALDGFENEPYQGPLTELENVLLTPHIGSYAAEGRLMMEIDAVENLLGSLGLKA